MQNNRVIARLVLLSALTGGAAGRLTAQGSVDTLSPVKVTAKAPDLGGYGLPVIFVSVMTPDGKPVEDALVRMREQGRIARTNWMGEASVYRVGFGMRRVEVLRLGFAPAVVDLRITRDTTPVQFVVEPLVDTLSTMWITAKRSSMPAGNLQEFNRRKQMGIGRFVDDTTFERHQLRDLVLLLPTLLPGLRAIPDPQVPGRYQLGSHRAGAGTSTRTLGGGCGVDTYLDGFLLTMDVDLLKPTDIAGAELYSMESAPAQFRRSPSVGSARDGRPVCHVLLLWSRW